MIIDLSYFEWEVEEMRPWLKRRQRAKRVKDAKSDCIGVCWASTYGGSWKKEEVFDQDVSS